MINVAQPGIFAQGTRAHYQLEFDVGPSASVQEIRAALARLHEPAVTAGGLNLVVGFGADLMRRLAPDAAPSSLAPFAAIEGRSVSVPATQHDIWIWLHGTGPDIALDAARAVTVALAPVAVLALEQPGFVYRDSRDLTGFIDGTENPPVAEAHGVAVIPDGEVGAGGCFVIAMRWVHDLTAFHALAERDQEGVIGRTRLDSVELDDDVKPVTAHIARVVVEDGNGEELEIFRRSVPYGTVSELGLYFLAFSADIDRFRIMLGRMFGTSEDGLSDALTTFTRPVTASFYFAPSVQVLAEIG
jgi:putative iron-dependent peroxidase